MTASAAARSTARDLPARLSPRGHPRTQSRSQPRATLTLVATRPLTAGRLPFAIFVGSILAGGLVALLLLHTMAAQDAFRLAKLEHSSAALSDAEQALRLTEQQREAPSALATRARALGMVPTGSIAFVKLHHHGKVVGVVRPAAAPAPVVSAAPTPSASSSPAPHQASAGKTPSGAGAQAHQAPSTHHHARRTGHG